MPPAYVIRHTYLGAGPEQMHHHRPVVMLANRIGDDNREADCSGRALATLVVAWVGAALVASVLLKWTDMWIALVVLTILFFAACGYAAYDAKRTHARALAREEERQLERRQRRERHQEFVSAGIDNFPEIIDNPEYQTYWVADLPPSYTAAMDLESPGNLARVANEEQQTGRSRPENAEAELPTGDLPRLSNPPPYAIAIQSEPLFIPLHNMGLVTREECPQHPPTIPDQNSIGVGQPTISLNGDHSSDPRLVLQVSNQSNTRDEDKVEEGPDQSVGENAGENNRSPLRRAQYLTSIINSTFGRRTARRTNNQQLHQTQLQANSNSAGPTITTPTNADNRQNDQQNNRNREQNLIVNNSTNNDRNIENNCSSVPGQTSPFPATLPGAFSNC